MIKTELIWLVCIFVINTTVSKPLNELTENHDNPNDEPPQIDDWIRQFGYPVENHEIDTEDGYLLTYHRIPYGKNGTSKNRPIAFVQHGVLATSGVWVSVEDSLGFMLADAGYDVWLGNARGSTYSRKHNKYDPDKDKEFWDFSWHEMGYYDLPAAIDYMLEVTGQSEVFYVGHSMGTTMYFVMGSTKPEYMDKIKASVLMAPVAYLWNVRSPFIRVLALFHPILQWLADHLGINEILPFTDSGYKNTQALCSNSRLQFICEDILFISAGFDKQQVDKALLPTYLQFLPGGGSARTFEHYGQIIKKGADFKQFDYGYIKNVEVYGSVFAPNYNISKVTAPTYIMYSDNDWLVHQQDALYTAFLLPNVPSTMKVADERWNHLDYQMGSDVKTLVYDQTLSIFSNYR